MATCPAHFLTSRYYRKFQFFSSVRVYLLVSIFFNMVSVPLEYIKFIISMVSALLK